MLMWSLRILLWKFPASDNSFVVLLEIQTLPRQHEQVLRDHRDELFQAVHNLFFFPVEVWKEPCNEPFRILVWIVSCNFDDRIKELVNVRLQDITLTLLHESADRRAHLRLRKLFASLNVRIPQLGLTVSISVSSFTEYLSILGSAAGVDLHLFVDKGLQLTLGQKDSSLLDDPPALVLVQLQSLQWQVLPF